MTQIISDLDTDGDGTLSEDEFSLVDSKEANGEVEKKTKEKKAEFRTAIDTDRDGKVSSSSTLRSFRWNDNDTCMDYMDTI